MHKQHARTDFALMETEHALPPEATYVTSFLPLQHWKLRVLQAPSLPAPYPDIDVDVQCACNDLRRNTRDKAQLTTT